MARDRESDRVTLSNLFPKYLLNDIHPWLIPWRRVMEGTIVHSSKQLMMRAL
jgi:hypothetical protein